MKGTEESACRVDSSASLTHHDPADIGLVCLVKKRKIDFRILSDLRIQHTVRLFTNYSENSCSKWDAINLKRKFIVGRPLSISTVSSWVIGSKVIQAERPGRSKN